jgi:hypothetical protein
MRALIAIILAAAVGGCTSVKMVQRDGCWVRSTEKLLGVREELGPCVRTASPWSEDRQTRLVQECVAREDYRWQMRALQAWNRGEAMPDGEANVLAACASDAAQVSFAENDALKNRLDAANERLSTTKERLTDVAADRDALRKRSELERDRMYSSHQKLAEALAEAAKKPSAPAVATATASSDGRARMDAKERTETSRRDTAPVALVNAPWMTAPVQPAEAPPRRASKKPAGPAKPVECVPPEQAVLACFPPAGWAPAAAPDAGTPVVEAGTAMAAPAQGEVVQAAEEKPAIGPAQPQSATK